MNEEKPTDPKPHYFLRFKGKDGGIFGKLIKYDQKALDKARKDLFYEGWTIVDCWVYNATKVND